MLRGLYVPKAESIEIRQYDDPPLMPHQLCIRKAFSFALHGCVVYSNHDRRL